MAENTSSTGTSRRDLLDRVWRAVGSEFVAIAILLAATAILFLASFLPQPPLSVVSDPGALDRWLTSTASRYGQAGPTMATFGLFSIGSSWWFNVTSALAVLHLLVRVADCSRFAARSLLPASPPPKGPLYAGSTEATISIPSAGDKALGQLHQALADSRLAIKNRHAAPDYPIHDQVYAHRFPLGTLGPAITALGMLLILLAGWADHTWGWHSQSNELVRGQSLALGGDLDWAVHLDSAASHDLAGSLVITSADHQTKHMAFDLGRPARYQGVSLNQIGSGPVLRISASDRNGSPLFVQSGQREEENGLELVFSRVRTERQATVPDANLALRVVLQSSGQGMVDEMAAPSFAVDVYQGGLTEPVYSDTVTSSSHFTLRETTVQLEVDRFAVMLASRRPAAPFRWLGAILLLLGLVIPLGCPGLQIWARTIPERRATRIAFSATTQAAGYDAQNDLNQIIGFLGGDDVGEA